MAPPHPLAGLALVASGSRAPPPVFLVAPVQGPHVFVAGAKVGLFERARLPASASEELRQERVVAVETPKVHYTGLVSESSKLAGQVERQLLFFIDREKGVAKLVNVNPLSQKPVVLSQFIPDLVDKVGEESTLDTYAERSESLVRNFGSQQRKRGLDKSAKGRVTADKIMGLDAVSEMLHEQFEDYAKVEAEAGQLLPTFDLSADTPQGAYPLEYLMSRAEREALSHVFIKGELEHAEKSGNFAGPRLADLAKDQDDGAKSELELALFFTILLRFYNGPRYFSAKDIASHQNIPIGLAKSLCTRFAEALEADEKVNFTRTDKCQIRVILALLVIALSINSYSLNVKDVDAIAKDLRKDADKLAPFLAQIGCKAKGSGSKKVWSLRAPLELPQVKPTKRARKGR